MLIVDIPESRIEESRYVLAIVLENFLGLEFDTRIVERDYFRISASEGDAELLLGADFFVMPRENWLKPDSLPVAPVPGWRPGSDGLSVSLVEDELPVLYGSPGLSRENACWRLKPDIFGTIFFMLSRYEELVIRERDRHDRFQASSSVAYSSGFLDRPIVDEYVEVLRKCLEALWPALGRKRENTLFELSCDVDQPFDCTVENLSSLMRSCAGDFIKRASPVSAVRRINRYMFNRIGNYRFDPYYTFQWYLDHCEQKGREVMFHFIADSRQPMNGCYRLGDPKIGRLLRLIYDRGHRIGMHASYQSYQSAEILRSERDRLQQALEAIGIDAELDHNRQHYLRWDASVTADCLDQAGFACDSSGSYADASGFRYGTCRAFPMWGWLSGRKLGLIQRPLIVMEVSVMESKYMGLGSGRAAAEYVERLKQRALRYGGRFSLLWHNSSLRNQAERNFFLGAIE